MDELLSTFISEPVVKVSQSAYITLPVVDSLKIEITLSDVDSESILNA